MDPLTVVVVIVAVLLTLSYFVGGALNRRRLARLVTALRGAFPATTDATVAWPARNAFHLELQDPLPRVRHMAVQGAVAPREAPLVWAFWALQGRGDLLDIRADLASPTPAEGVAFDAGDRLGRAAGQAAVSDGMEVGAPTPERLRIATREASGRALLERLVPVAATAGRVLRVEVRAMQPRLALTLSLGGDPSAIAAGIARALSELVAALEPR